MEGQTIQLAGGYVIDWIHKEYYTKPNQEWPTGYGWFYIVTHNHVQVATDGPFESLLEVAESAFDAVAEYESDHNRYEYWHTFLTGEGGWCVEAANIDDDTGGGANVVFAEYLFDADRRANQTDEFIRVRIAAHNAYIRWLEQEKSRENAAT